MQSGEPAFPVDLLWQLNNCSGSWFLLTLEFMCVIINLTKHFISMDVIATGPLSIMIISGHFGEPINSDGSKLKYLLFVSCECLL